MAVDLQELARRMLADYDARTPGRLFAEALASGGMHAGFVLAEERPEDGLANLESLSVWIDQPMGLVAGTDLTALAIRSVRWLAERLAERGLTLAGGQVVLTGSLLPLYAVRPGNRGVASVAPVGRSSAVIVT
jgi:2-keto-4-pentenoate hydratase